MISRRNLLKSVGGILIAAPFVAKSGILMPISREDLYGSDSDKLVVTLSEYRKSFLYLDNDVDKVLHDLTSRRMEFVRKMIENSNG